MIKITEHRLSHSLAVARLMHDKALELSYNEDYAKEMFTLGYLHDIGYEYTDIKEQHPQIGGEILKKSNYKYWKEVYYHGSTDIYSSFELDLLNYADLMINSRGKIVGFEQRLNDLKERYGEQSCQYQKSLIIIKENKISNFKTIS